MKQAKQGPLLDLPDGTSQDIEPDRLLLDPQNLRLLERVDGGLMAIDVKLIGQKSVQDKLYRTFVDSSIFDISSLAKSIAYNGFLKHERLIVARYDGTSFLVLEGNRRVSAVRNVFEKSGENLQDLTPQVRQSLQTLPCFVLNGEPIGSSRAILDSYRRASEIYIGMRHLMGAKSWEPASRYEFQAKLINEEGWTPADVAERFGRDKSVVMRDLKAQKLYNDFRKFEVRTKIGHSLTYNAFAEAARAPAVVRWLGWSNKTMEITHKDREEAFFHYLLARLKSNSDVTDEEATEGGVEESAEAVVRRLRDMLKLGDSSIENALLDRKFAVAELEYEEKREGDFARRVAGYTRGLKRASSDELGTNPRENKKALTELSSQTTKTILIVDALLKK
jgi:hypothetical protein